jgi:hypothetical protein
MQPVNEYLDRVSKSLYFDKKMNHFNPSTKLLIGNETSEDIREFISDILSEPQDISSLTIEDTSLIDCDSEKIPKNIESSQYYESLIESANNVKISVNNLLASSASTTMRKLDRQVDDSLKDFTQIEIDSLNILRKNAQFISEYENNIRSAPDPGY